MKLSIIIVSWNTCELTLKCIKSIFRFVKDIKFEVFVVDNNSGDNTIEELENYKNRNDFTLSSRRKSGSIIQYLKHLHLDPSRKMRDGDDKTNKHASPYNLKIISNKENVGFAKANNQAIRIAKGKYVLLLNPDTELIDDGVTKMTEFMNNNELIGIVGSKLLNSDDTLQRSCRQFPGLLDQLFIQLKFYNFFPNKIKWVRNYFMLDFDHNEIKEVDQVMGAAMLIRREVFNKIGLFDEKFWTVFEEVDFCKRAKDAGYKIYFFPNTKIIHHKEQSFRQVASLRKQINFNHSLYHYFKKHKPIWQLIVLWLVQPVNLVLTLVDEVVGVRKMVGKRKDL